MDSRSLVERLHPRQMLSAWGFCVPGSRDRGKGRLLQLTFAEATASIRRVARLIPAIQRGQNLNNLHNPFFDYERQSRGQRV